MPSSTYFIHRMDSYLGQLRITSVMSCLSFAHISDVDQMTAQTGSTEVGLIRFSNRCNNCRVGKINDHCQILRLSLSLCPTKDKDRTCELGI